MQYRPCKRSIDSTVSNAGVSLLVTDQVQCWWPWLMTVILLCGSAMIWCSQCFCGHHYFQSSLQQLPLTVLNWPRLVRVAFWATWGSSTPLHTLRRPGDCYRITIAYHESTLRRWCCSGNGFSKVSNNYDTLALGITLKLLFAYYLAELETNPLPSCQQFLIKKGNTLFQCILWLIWI